MKVNAVQCPNCKDVIYSRARHDFHDCSCGQSFIDGGFDYCRYGGQDMGRMDIIEIEVDSTEGELYDDWNNSTGKFGIIKGNQNG